MWAYCFTCATIGGKPVHGRPDQDFKSGTFDTLERCHNGIMGVYHLY